MGLDIGLGALVLLWAIRGWFKGFLRQAVGLGALVGSVYSAAPLRDLARPHVHNWLPSIQEEVLDRMLWWVGVVLSFVILAGVGGWLVRLVRRKPASALPIPSEPNRADQGAGFLFGALKGAIVASFLAAGLVRFAPVYLEPMGEGKAVVEEQTKASKALTWAAQYHPAEQIWESVPVKAFVAQVKRNGLWLSDETVPEGKTDDRSGAREPGEELRTASRVPALQVEPPRLDPGSATHREEVDRMMKRYGLPDRR